MDSIRINIHDARAEVTTGFFPTTVLPSIGDKITAYVVDEPNGLGKNNHEWTFRLRDSWHFLFPYHEDREDLYQFSGDFISTTESADYVVEAFLNQSWHSKHPFVRYSVELPPPQAGEIANQMPAAESVKFVVSASNKYCRLTWHWDADEKRRGGSNTYPQVQRLMEVMQTIAPLKDWEIESTNYHRVLDQRDVPSTLWVNP